MAKKQSSYISRMLGGLAVLAILAVSGALLSSSMDSHLGQANNLDVICTYDYGGNPIYGGGTSYWSDGGYERYDENCGIVETYYPDYGDYDDDYYDDNYDNYQSCGLYDAYGAEIWPNSWYYYGDGTYTIYDDNCNPGPVEQEPNYDGYNNYSSCTDDLIALLGSECHDMGDAWFDGPMNNYVNYNDNVVHSCANEPITSCTGYGGYDDDYYNYGSCTDDLIALLDTGCHDMGNAWFDGPMNAYVYYGETTVHSCDTEPISGCSNSYDDYYNYDACSDDMIEILGNECHDMYTGAYFNGAMTEYVYYGDTTVHSCNTDSISGCSNNYDDYNYSSCSDDLIDLLGDGCHDMSYEGAWFDGPMNAYVYYGETTVHSCSTEPIQGCTSYYDPIVDPVCDGLVDDFGGPVYPNSYVTVNGYSNYYDSDCEIDPLYDPYFPEDDEYCFVAADGSYVYPWGTEYHSDGSYSTYDGDCNYQDTYNNYYDPYNYYDITCEDFFDDSLGLQCSDCTQEDGTPDSLSCWNPSGYYDAGEYTYEDYTDGNLQCSASFENGVEVNRNCWFDGFYDYSSDSYGVYWTEGNMLCDAWYTDGFQTSENCWTDYDTNFETFTDSYGRTCNREYNTAGDLQYYNCWQDYGTDDGYYGAFQDQDEWKQKYILGATCTSHTQGYNWCEICETPNGTVIEDFNTCQDGLAPDPVDEELLGPVPFPFYELTDEEIKRLEQERIAQEQLWEKQEMEYFDDVKDFGDEWLLEEVAFMREEIGQFENAVLGLQSYGSGTTVERDFTDAVEVLGKAFSLLDRIEDEAGSFDDHKRLDELFNKLENLEGYIKKPVENINDFFRTNRNLGLNSEQLAMVELLADFDDHSGPGGPGYDDDCRRCDYMQDVYAVDTITGLEDIAKLGDFNLDALVTSLIAEIQGEILATVLEYVDTAVADKITSAVIERVDLLKKDVFANMLGDNAANDILANTAIVAEKVTGTNFPTVGNYTALQDVQTRISNTAIVDDEQLESVTEFLETVEVTVEAASVPSPVAINGLVVRGEELFLELEEDLYENNLGFRDMPNLLDEDMEDIWYGPTVWDGVGEGYWSGYTDGSFGPGNSTLDSEFTKMAVEVYGLDVSTTTGGDWWEGYETAAYYAGSTLDIDNDAASRGEVMQTLYELGGFDRPSTCDGYFTDLDSSNPNCEAIVALYNEGIVTGDPDGSVRPDAGLNRAEASALIMRVDELQNAAEFATDSDFFETDLQKKTKNGFFKWLFTSVLAKK